MVSLSIILKGGYIEHTAAAVRRRRAGSFVLRRAKHAHRIELLRDPGRPVVPPVDTPAHFERLPAWTLFITGPKVREWGFHCPQGWRHWREFVSEVDSGNVGKGCEP